MSQIFQRWQHLYIWAVNPKGGEFKVLTSFCKSQILLIFGMHGQEVVNKITFNIYQQLLIIVFLTKYSDMSQSYVVLEWINIQ